ncbi:MAG: amidase family protein, partial [Deltaproteobacteria bacterium]|nr:amidase family protein [Deltaproteobacteria bacterium]
RGLKVAWSPDLGHARVDPEVARICAQAAQAFEQAGALVEEVNPGWADPRPILDPLWLGGYAARLHTRLEEWGSRMDPGLVTLVREGTRISGTAFAEAQMARIGFWDVVRPFFHRYDLLLTPTVSVVALKCGLLNPPGWPQHPWDWFPWAPFSFPFNLTGQPAATVPAGFSASGLPVGLQIVGRRFADLTVLQASAAYEKVRPWAGTWPVL